MLERAALRKTLEVILFHPEVRRGDLVGFAWSAFLIRLDSSRTDHESQPILIAPICDSGFEMQTRSDYGVRTSSGGGPSITSLTSC